MEDEGMLHDTELCQIIIGVLVQRLGGKVTITEPEVAKLKGFILHEQGNHSEHTTTITVLPIAPSTNSCN